MQFWEKKKQIKLITINWNCCLWSSDKYGKCFQIISYLSWIVSINSDVCSAGSSLRLVGTECEYRFNHISRSMEYIFVCITAWFQFIADNKVTWIAFDTVKGRRFSFFFLSRADLYESNRTNEQNYAYQFQYKYIMNIKHLLCYLLIITICVALNLFKWVSSYILSIQLCILRTFWSI